MIFSGLLEKKSKLRNFFEKNEQILCVPCYPDNEKDLEIIIREEFKKNQLPLTREISNLLIEKSNNDRNNVRNEIKKITSFALNKNKLDIDQIKSLVNFSGDYKSDIFINECLCGNISQYKKILEEMYSNVINQILMFRILSNKIQRLIKMKEEEENYDNLESQLNMFRPLIFWKEKPMVKVQLRRWNLSDLKKIIYEINNTELACKRNPEISKIIFFDFFSKICMKTSNFS